MRGPFGLNGLEFQEEEAAKGGLVEAVGAEAEGREVEAVEGVACEEVLRAVEALLKLISLRRRWSCF